MSFTVILIWIIAFFMFGTGWPLGKTLYLLTVTPLCILALWCLIADILETLYANNIKFLTYARGDNWTVVQISTVLYFGWLVYLNIFNAQALKIFTSCDFTVNFWYLLSIVVVTYILGRLWYRMLDWADLRQRIKGSR
jgi:hypothetical protein